MKMSEVTYEERAARGARTQSLFRAVNERVREINDAFSSVVPLGDWICECADDACSEQVSRPTAVPGFRAVPSGSVTCTAATWAWRIGSSWPGTPRRIEYALGLSTCVVAGTTFRLGVNGTAPQPVGVNVAAADAVAPL